MANDEKRRNERLHKGKAVNPPSIPQIFSATSKILENAQELIEEAELLLENNRYPRAFALVAFGLEWRRSSREGRSARAERRARAYTMLLARSGVIAHTTSGLHVAMEARSGLREGLNVMLRLQKPPDPLDLIDRLRADIQPLYEAWSEVWVVGSKEAISEANDLVAQCGTVMGAATQQGKARPEFLRMIAGEKWTQAKLDQWEKELRSLAEARRRFAATARREAGVEVADLFSSGQSKHLSNV